MKPAFQNYGMACPECRERRTAVIDSRVTHRLTVIRRRRQCFAGHRFTTYESVAAPQSLHA